MQFTLPIALTERDLIMRKLNNKKYVTATYILGLICIIIGVLPTMHTAIPSFPKVYASTLLFALLMLVGFSSTLFSLRLSSISVDNLENFPNDLIMPYCRFTDRQLNSVKLITFNTIEITNDIQLCKIELKHNHLVFTANSSAGKAYLKILQYLLKQNAVYNLKMTIKPYGTIAIFKNNHDQEKIACYVESQAKPVNTKIIKY